MCCATESHGAVHSQRQEEIEFFSHNVLSFNEEGLGWRACWCLCAGVGEDREGSATPCWLLITPVAGRTR